MALNAAWALLCLLEGFREEMTYRAFAHLLGWAVGWLRTSGRHAVTESLVQTGLAGKHHHAGFHRFFQLASWSIDGLGRVLFALVLPWALQLGEVRLVLDDSLARHKGPHIWGLGSHLDAVQSRGNRYRVFSFGHCWVVLCVLVQPTFSSRPWALPVLCRLYWSEKACKALGRPFRSKSDLGRELVQLACEWVRQLHPSGRVSLRCDSAYCNRTLLRRVPQGVHVYGELKLNARLTLLPSAVMRKRHPLRRYGRKLPPLRRVGSRQPWQKCRAKLYGQTRTQQVYPLQAQWRGVTGPVPLHVVLVRCTSGTRPLRAYFSTDANATNQQVLEGCGERWAIEVTFREVKQQLGLDEPTSRSPKAVLRTAPLVALLYTLLATWFERHIQHTPLSAPVDRPWYPQRKHASFADILRSAQSALATLDISALYQDLSDSSEKRNRPLSDRNPANYARAA